MWAKRHRAGLQSQDAIWAHGLINEAGLPQAGSTPVERRRAPRNVQRRHDESRVAARSVEFACVALFIAAFGITAFGAVGQALAAPLSQIRAALGPEAD
jgi:Flp pilus assembly pilin Flp